jgi:hypothetical protein
VLTFSDHRHASTVRRGPRCSLLQIVRTVGPGAVALFMLSAALSGCSLPRSTNGERPTAQSDAVSGRLRRLAFATTGNGRNNAVAILNGTRLERIDVDKNGDGQIDRWEFYDVNRRLEKVGFSRRGDGVMDALVIYGPKGAVVRVEISTRSDGRFNRREFYQAESLTRVEEDTNGDGVIDKWETYAVDPRATPGQPSSIVTAAFDDHFRGTPSRRLQYGPDGSILRVEIDPEGNGTFSEWKAGKNR